MSESNEVETEQSLERRTRRRFPGSEKQRLLAEMDALPREEKGAWLRRNGLYAAQLAAIMSTISSQLLVASSSLVEDFYRLFLRKNASESESVTIGRACVLLVGIVAAIIASDPTSNVLGLVSHAWAGFGAAFGPLILLSLTWPRMSGSGAVAGLVAGAVTVIVWIALGWDSSFLGGPGVYEIIPGFIAGMAAICIVSLATETSGEYRPIPAG